MAHTDGVSVRPSFYELFDSVALVPDYGPPGAVTTVSDLLEPDVIERLNLEPVD